MTDIPKAKRGFALLSPERRREVASKGGKGCPAEKRAFKDRELAKRAGLLGGHVKKP
jgi:general stress protein YciG